MLIITNHGHSFCENVRPVILSRQQCKHKQWLSLVISRQGIEWEILWLYWSLYTSKYMYAYYVYVAKSETACWLINFFRCKNIFTCGKCTKFVFTKNYFTIIHMTFKKICSIWYAWKLFNVKFFTLTFTTRKKRFTVLCDKCILFWSLHNLQKWKTK